MPNNYRNNNILERKEAETNMAYEVCTSIDTVLKIYKLCPDKCYFKLSIYPPGYANYDCVDCSPLEELEFMKDYSSAGAPAQALKMLYARVARTLDKYRKYDNFAKIDVQFSWGFGHDVCVKAYL